jgi:hypothetical protein
MNQWQLEEREHVFRFEGQNTRAKRIQARDELVLIDAQPAARRFQSDLSDRKKLSSRSFSGSSTARRFGR